MKLRLSILMLIVLISCTTLGNIAIGEDSWVCPNCSLEMTGKFCSECGSPRPEEETGPLLTIIDQTTDEFITAEETAITLVAGESRKILINADEWGLIFYKLENENICKATWGDFLSDDPNTCELIINGIATGVAKVKVYKVENPEISVSIEVQVTPSKKEKEELNKVQYIGDLNFFYYEDYNYYALLFSLKDKDKNRIAAPLTVEVRIINDNDETVYEKDHYITTADFGTWTDSFYGERYLACVEILPDDIRRGTTNKGTVYFKVHQSGYIYFDECSIDTTVLPKVDLTEQCSLALPTLPLEIKRYSYSKKVDTMVDLTDISYTFEENYDGTVTLHIFLTGEKTYDSESDTLSSKCAIGWKLYDEDNYVIDSGTFKTDDLATGEKFKNKEEKIWNIAPGKYTLKLLDCN